MNQYYLYVAIAILVIIAVVIIIKNLLGKDYEFSSGEEEDLRLLDIMEDCNKTDLIFKEITLEKYKENQKELINVLDRIEKAHRKDKKR